MDLVSQFIARYRKEYDYYEQACRLAAQLLDSHLQSGGIRAIVTSRAKSPIRLEAKVRQRARTKGYDTIDDVFEDIVDLAGVRVALYFPAERNEVGRIIRSIFVTVAEPKDFPSDAAPSYSKRFSGYWATHYRVRIDEKALNESQKRYAEARIEIQVASVLMHAWSEVEHDLVYKPLQGRLSDDEYAILDELNGLVLTGEIALERLQRAGELRVSSIDREYTNHYDLAASLLELSREKLAGINLHDSVVGRVDLLFSLLRECNLSTPQHLQRYVSALHSDFERRPIAEQIIDQVLAEDSTRYAIFDRIRVLDIPVLQSIETQGARSTQNQEIGNFIALWIELERLLHASAASLGSTPTPPFRALTLLSGLPEDLRETGDRLRRFRNQLVHGIEIPEAEYIRAQTSDLQNLIGRIRAHLSPKAKRPRRSRKTRDISE